MIGKPVIRRAVADDDIGEAVDYYAAESVAVADRFIDELKRNVDMIGKTPTPTKLTSVCASGA